MKNACFVGFDTSNYTTSVSVCSYDGRILANIKLPLPVKDGECGLRQSDAVFAHVKNLPEALAKLREEIRDLRVLAVGYSARPRNLEGSYMPCFLSGRVAAEAFAASLDLPLFSFSHQDGHVMAALYSSGRLEELIQKPFCAFHVSGGTTEVLSVTPDEDGFAIELIGGSADLNAGQAIDRVGVMMGLHFPCGREMESLAARNERQLPAPRVCVKDGYCNLSGLQNIAERLWRESENPAYVSAYVFSFLAKTLKELTTFADSRFPGSPIVYAGGVMSNRILQKALGTRQNSYFAEPVYSADNAAGIALLCRRAYLKK